MSRKIIAIFQITLFIDETGRVTSTMMIETVCISDTNDNLVFEYLVHLTSPSYQSLAYLLRSQDRDEKNLSFIEINKKSIACYQERKPLRLYVICLDVETMNPALPLVFLQRLIEIIEDYFGKPLAPLKIEANSDTLTMLLAEIIDDGVPNITDINQLREIVPFKSLLSRILLSTNQISKAATLSNFLSRSTNKEDNPVPWKNAGTKYTNNEMYVDVSEQINVILKSTNKVSSKGLISGKAFDSAFYSSSSWSQPQKLIPISGVLNGKIDFVSHLSGVPLLQMILQFHSMHALTPSFHPSIDLKQWLNTPGYMSFIPPDGNSTLMDYQIDLDSVDKSYKDKMLGIIDVDYQWGLGPHQNEFEVRLFINMEKSVSKIENLVVNVYYQSFGNSEEETDRRIIKTNRVTHGDISTKNTGKLEWNLRTLSTGVQASLHGTLLSSSRDLTPSFEDSDTDLISEEPKEQIPLKPLYISLSYTHKGRVPSGLKVESLKITSAKGLGDTVKPYKGVKYVTKTGNYIIR